MLAATTDATTTTTTLYHTRHHHRKNICTNCQHMFEIQNEHTNKNLYGAFSTSSSLSRIKLLLCTILEWLKNYIWCTFSVDVFILCSRFFASNVLHSHTHTHRPSAHVPNFIFKMLFYSHFLSFTLLFLRHLILHFFSMRIYLMRFVIHAWCFLFLCPATSSRPYLFCSVSFPFRLCLSSILLWKMWWYDFFSLEFTISLWNDIKSFYYYVFVLMSITYMRVLLMLCVSLMEVCCCCVFFSSSHFQFFFLLCIVVCFCRWRYWYYCCFCWCCCYCEHCRTHYFSSLCLYLPPPHFHRFSRI